MAKAMKEFLYHFGLKLRIYPDYLQRKIIKINSDASRFVYNEMVYINLELWKFGNPKIYIKGVTEKISELNRLKNSTSALKDKYFFLRDKNVDSLAIDNAKRNYQNAWKLYREIHSHGTPNFHRKTYLESYQTNPHYKTSDTAHLTNANVRFLDAKYIQLPKLGKIRFKGSLKRLQRLFEMDKQREIRIGTLTISRDGCGDYYVSMQLASDEPFVKPFELTGSRIGIDLNLENFYADSFGNIIDNPRYYRAAKKRLKNSQRILARRILRAKKDKRPLITAQNVQKQRKLVAELQNRVMKRRDSFQHILSAALIKNHDLVAAEELRSKNLLKNHALAMSISDAGWRSFLSKLEYKAKLYGKIFITVDPKNTTQTCSACGHVMSGEEKLTLKDREWLCPKCGTHHIRDVNAAKNILSKALQSV